MGQTLMLSSGRSVTEVQGSEGCSYISNHCSWYEGRRSSYLLFKYREGACRVIIFMHNKPGSSLGWPLDRRPSSSHHNCQTAAPVSPAVFTQKRPCATFPSNIKNYFKEVVRRIKILARIFTYTSLSEKKKKNNTILKQYEAAETKVKLGVFGEGNSSMLKCILLPEYSQISKFFAYSEKIPLVLQI